MEGTPRTGWSMAVAIALHVSAFAGLRLARPPAAAPAPAAREEITLDLALDPDPPPRPAPPADAPSEGATRGSATTAVARAAAPHRARGAIPVAPLPGAGDGAAVENRDAPSPPATPAGELVPAPASRNDALPPPLVPRAIHAPGAVFDMPLAPSGTSVVPGAGGQVLGLARSIADTKAPRRGRGTIEIEADANGNVTRVRSTSPSWEGFARELQARLAGKRLRVQTGAQGVLVRLAVLADETSAPAVLTGEAQAKPCRPPDQERDQAGRVDHVMNVGCNPWDAFVPVTRHRVTVSVAGEQSL